MSKEKIEFIDKLDFILDTIGGNNLPNVSLNKKYAPESSFKETIPILYKGRREYHLIEDEDVDLSFGDYSISNAVEFVEIMHPLALNVSASKYELFNTLRDNIK